MAGPRRSREEGWKVEEEEAYYQVDDEESPWGPWGTHGQEGNGVGCARGVRRGESPGNVPGHTGPFLRDELVKFIESVKLGENRLSPLSLSHSLSLSRIPIPLAPPSSIVDRPSKRCCTFTDFQIRGWKGRTFDQTFFDRTCPLPPRDLALERDGNVE